VDCTEDPEVEGCDSLIAAGLITLPTFGFDETTRCSPSIVLFFFLFLQKSCSQKKHYTAKINKND